MAAARMKGRDAAGQGAALSPPNAACPSGQSGLSIIIAVAFLPAREIEILHRLGQWCEAHPPLQRRAYTSWDGLGFRDQGPKVLATLNPYAGVPPVAK
jgi:hypothetical protein